MKLIQMNAQSLIAHHQGIRTPKLKKMFSKAWLESKNKAQNYGNIHMSMFRNRSCKLKTSGKKIFSQA
jgi:hypothetical protein